MFLLWQLKPKVRTGEWVTAHPDFSKVLADNVCTDEQPEA